MGDFCHQGRDTEIARKKLRLSEPTDMTIQSAIWKALEEHFMMVPLVFQFSGGKMHFLNLQKRVNATWVLEYWKRTEL
jgi:hypothetical protein